VQLNCAADNFDGSTECSVLKTRMFGILPVNMVLIPCVDTVYRGIRLKLFLIVYSEVHE
jgi:hypothetical protein